MERLARDIADLAAYPRGSASPAEQRSAAIIERRLGEIGVEEVRRASYRSQGTYAGAHLLHMAAGLLAARRGSRALALATAASLELEVSGRRQWTRALLPTGEGVNVIARIPAAGERRRTLVLVAHHDAARTGFIWRRAFVRGDVARRIMPPRGLAPAVGLAAIATGTRLGRTLGAALLAVTTAGLVDTATQRTVPGADDNASGVAGVLALAERLHAEPIAGVEVLLAFPGAEESGMAGMRAFLDDAGLDPASSFVLGLDTIGSGTPVVLHAEGTMLPHRYRAEDVARVPAEVQRWRGGAWTDPILAVQRGIPTVSILSVGPDGCHAHWHRPDDTPENVDLGCVARCVEIAEETARGL